MKNEHKIANRKLTLPQIAGWILRRMGFGKRECKRTIFPQRFYPWVSYDYIPLNK